MKEWYETCCGYVKSPFSYVWWETITWIALLKKNFLYFFRAWKISVFLCITPILMIFFLWVVIEIVFINLKTFIVRSGDLELDTDFGIPQCIPFGGRPCTTIVYAPNSTLTNTLMSDVLAWNDLTWDDALRMDNYSVLYDFMKSHPNTSSIYVYFDVQEDHSKFGKLINYTIFYNDTQVQNDDFTSSSPPDLTFDVQFAIDNAITKYNSNLQQQFSLADNIIDPLLSVWFRHGFPENAANSTDIETETDDVIRGVLFASVGTMIFQFSVVAVWVVVLYFLMFEKERRLRGSMEVMGLKSSTYFLSWFTTAGIILIISALLVIAIGAAFQFDFFLKTNFFVLFFLLLDFGFAMIGLSFLIHSIFSTALVSLIFAFVICAVAFVVNSIVNGLTTYMLYEFRPGVAKWAFIWYPSFHFSKICSDITVKLSLNSENTFKFGDIYKTIQNPFSFGGHGTSYIPAPWEALAHIFWNGCAMFLLSFYLDEILNSTQKVRRSWYFPFTLSYWGIYPKFYREWRMRKISTVKRMKEILMDYSSTEDEEVRTEIEQVFSSDREEDCIRIVGLNHIYKNMICKGRSVHAVKNLCLNIKRGQCFALLGKNGSGKTTTINALIGSLHPSSGTSFVFGRNTAFEIDQIRKVIGVCPQHNILFDQYLTAYEHISLFCSVKNIPFWKHKRIARGILNDVGLFDVRNNLVHTFSGGMQRRLSIAIALVGDPELVVLDEPTTGLDAKNRSKIWDLITKLKKTKSCLLTTHSMNEADNISDRIAIMKEGRLTCIGNQVSLKSRYGDGYTLHVVCHTQENVGRVMELMNAFSREYIIITKEANSVVFNLPNSELKDLIPFIKRLEDNTEIIKDFSISSTSLEEVFIKVTK